MNYISSFNSVKFCSKASLHKLTELLPYKIEDKNHKEYPKVIKEYSALLIATLNTINAMSEDRFNLLDPLVGENFCQSRALKIASRWNHCLESFQSKKHFIETAITQLNERFSDKSHDWFTKNNLKLDSIINENLGINLTDDEIFFVMSYMLTLVKVKTVSKNTFLLGEKTDLKKLKELAPLQTNFVNQLIANIRQKLASTSVQYIRKLANESKIIKNIRMVSEIYMRKHNKLDSIPSFWGTRIIFKEALKANVPLVFITRQIDAQNHQRIKRELAVFFRPTIFGYKEQFPIKEDFERPVIVISGVTCNHYNELSSKDRWRRILNKHNPIKILEAHGASHRQYPDSTDETVENDPEIFLNKAKANHYGFSLANPSVFLPTHIYPEKVKNIKELKYTINCHLKSYHDFYRKRFKEHVLDYFKNTACKVRIEKSRIVLKYKGTDKLREFVKSLNNNTFIFMVVPKIETNRAGDSVDIKLKIDDSYCFLDDILKVSKSHSDPVTFLLDHRAYWTFRANEVIEFLISDSTNFENSDLIEVLVDRLRENGLIESLLQSLIGLGKALNIPSLKEKAKSILMEFAEMDDPEYSIDRDELRQCAWKQLAAIAEEGDVKSLFEKIIDDEKNLALKTVAINCANKS